MCLDKEVGLKWLTLAQENEKSLWTCNLPASLQSQCSNGPSLLAQVISGSTEASSWAGLYCSDEAHFLACVRPCFWPLPLKRRREANFVSQSYRAWVVSAKTSSSPASQLSGPLVCHTEVRFTAELKRCPGFSACKITCRAYKCVGVWPYKLRNNYPHVLRHSHLLTLRILPREHFILGSQIFCCCCKYLILDSTVAVLGKNEQWTGAGTIDAGEI